MSDYPYRYDLMNPFAMILLAGVLFDGAKRYGETNWRNISAKEHINHALGHLFQALIWLDSDDKETTPILEDLSHAFCRVMFALGKVNDEL
ncbi:MAG: dATP/dGTP diphosphohydrolase domain-containing protein [Candidatus Gracilibacteria bacterium]